MCFVFNLSFMLLCYSFVDFMIIAFFGYDCYEFCLKFKYLESYCRDNGR